MGRDPLAVGDVDDIGAGGCGGAADRSCTARGREIDDGWSPWAVRPTMVWRTRLLQLPWRGWRLALDGATARVMNHSCELVLVCCVCWTTR